MRCYAVLGVHALQPAPGVQVLGLGGSLVQLSLARRNSPVALSLRAAGGSLFPAAWPFAAAGARIGLVGVSGWVGER
jgi:hypothetical protein